MNPGLMCATALVLLLIATSCTRSSAARQPSRQKSIDNAVAALKSLHNKIVFVVWDTGPEGTFDDQEYSLYWVDPAGGKPRLLLKSRNPAAEGVNTQYLPGRDKILVHMAVSGNTRTGNDYVAHIDGSDPKLLVRGKVIDLFPDHGHMLVRSDLSDYSQSFFLYSTDMNGRHPTRLTFLPKGVKRKVGPQYMYEGDWWADVSPDGSTIVYETSWYSQGGGPSDVVRVDSDGSHLRRLTLGEKSGISFSLGGISHDGRRIALEETHDEGSEEQQSFLTLIDLRGRVLRKYPLHGATNFFAWSPDDKKIGLIGEPGIGVLDLETGKVATAFSPPDISRLGFPAVPRDSAAWLD